MNYNEELFSVKTPRKYKSEYYAENRDVILEKQAIARKKARKKRNDHNSYMRRKAAGYYDKPKQKPTKASLLERIYAFFLGGVL